MQVLKPTRKNVLIGFEKKENKTASGLILTSDVSGEAKVGIVMGRGPDAQDVQIDDRVIADWSKATDIGSGQVMINQDDIWGVLND
jgi:co-chaperonin GroES (HSP10)